jgi:hypothetical protein
MASPFYYPNQRGGTYKQLHQQQQLNQQFTMDQRQQQRQYAAKQLRQTIDQAAKHVNGVVKHLEHFVHSAHHNYEQDHISMHGAEEFDHLSNEIQNLAALTHTEIQHSPLSHMPEFHQGHVEGGEAGLFQVIATFVILLRRIQLMRNEAKQKARRDANDVKGWLNKIRALAKKR